MTEYNIPPIDLTPNEIARIADDARRDASLFGLHFFETKDLIDIMEQTFERLS